MKTPHRIMLIRGGGATYDPVADSYTTASDSRQEVACLVTVINQAKVFETYGDRELKVISCRFQKVQQPFEKAVYAGETYSPIETITTPIKGAVRLKKVGG